MMTKIPYGTDWAQSGSQKKKTKKNQTMLHLACSYNVQAETLPVSYHWTPDFCIDQIFHDYRADCFFFVSGTHNAHCDKMLRSCITDEILLYIFNTLHYESNHKSLIDNELFWFCCPIYYNAISHDSIDLRAMQLFQPLEIYEWVATMCCHCIDSAYL